MNRADTLAGKIALITGSSTGIGAATALELARRGVRVILHGRTESENLISIADQVSIAGVAVKTVCCDFSSLDSLDSFAETVWQQFGGLDILVNNAGVDVLTGALADASFFEKFDNLWRVDVAATLILSRLLGRRMLESATADSLPAGKKSIVNIGWDQAHQGMSGDSGEMFATIKGAVMSMTRSLAQSLAPQVRVNCVAPGWIKTKWGNTASDSWNDRAVNESLMHRWGQPQDVARAIVWLAAPGASFVSGQILPVNGGYRFFQGESES